MGPEMMTRLRTFSHVEEHRACAREQWKTMRHDLRSRTNKKKNEQVEQKLKPNENDVHETGMKPSGKKEERTREGNKAHNFDVFCESCGVVVEMTKEEKENKIKQTEMFVRFVLKNDENNMERLHRKHCLED